MGDHDKGFGVYGAPEAPREDETVYEDADETVYSDREVFLEVVQGEGQGRVYEVDKERMVFGRQTEDFTPDIVLADPNDFVNRRFSRLQAELRLRDDAVELTSHYRKSQGVLVNGRPLTEGQSVELQDGDVVKMFTMAFKVRITSEDALYAGAAAPAAEPGAAPPQRERSRASGAWKATMAVALVVLVASAGAAAYAYKSSKPSELYFQTAWKVPTGGAITGSPTVAFVNRGQVLDVVVGSEDGNVYALDGKTGAQLWTDNFQTGDKVSSAAAAADLDGDGVTEVVQGSCDGKVYCLNGNDGGVLWVNENLGGPVHSSPALADVNEDTVQDVIVGCDDGNIYALRGDTGGIIWKYATKGPVYASPTVADLEGDGEAEVLCGSCDTNFYVLRASTGELLRTLATKGRIISSASIADLDGDAVKDIVFVSNDFTVYAINGATGVTLGAYELPNQWMVPPPRVTESMVASSPALGDLNRDGVPDAVLGCYMNLVIALNGRNIAQELWKFPTGSFVLSSPALADLNKDGVPDAIVGCDDGNLYMIDGSNGKKIRTIAVGSGPISAAPAVADLTGAGTLSVAVGSEDGSLMVVKSSSPAPKGHVAWAGLLQNMQHQGQVTASYSWEFLILLGVAGLSLLVVAASGVGMAVTRRG